jgi:hypothetical protein
MATEKQIAANKRNAKKSTGPRTQQGKARSRINALRHGLSSVVANTPVNESVLSSEDSNSIATVQNKLQQICSERVKILGVIDPYSRQLTLRSCVSVSKDLPRWSAIRGAAILNLEDAPIDRLTKIDPTPNSSDSIFGATLAPRLFSLQRTRVRNLIKRTRT